MPPSSPPVQPVVPTLDQEDDKDVAEDAPMPAQPLLPAGRPRAASKPATQASPEASAVVARLVDPPVQVAPVPAALRVILHRGWHCLWLHTWDGL